METNDIKELIATVEAIRAEKHPELPQKLLEAVVSAEESNSDDTDALRAIQSIIDDFASRTGT